MKLGLLNLMKSTLPALLLGSLLAMTSSVPLMAQGRGSGHGGGGHASGGRSFSGGRSGGGGYGGGQRGYRSGGGYAGAQRGFAGGGRSFSGNGYAHGDVRGGHDFGRGFYRGGRWYGYGYYGGPAIGYGYDPYVCNPSGYYDQAGYWHPYPGCYAGPFGY